MFFNNTANPVTNNGQTVDPWTFQLGDTSSGAGWVYYRNGYRCLINGNKTISLTTDANPSLAGSYYIYINNNSLGNLTVSNNVWDLRDPNIIPVATIRFNNTLTPNYWMANERHTALIDRKIHYVNHNTQGTQLILNGGITGYTVNTSSDAANTFGVNDTVLADEDIIFTNSALVDPNGLTDDYIIVYRTGPSTWVWKKSPLPFSYTTGSYIDYDNNGTLTTGGANSYYNTYLIYTNLIGNARFMIVSGRSAFANLTEAQAEDPASFTWTGIPLAEYVIAYQFTWTTGNSYNNTGKVRLAAEPRSINISSTSASAVSSSSHNDLSGLQGGFLNEHYHLTSAEHAYIQGIYGGSYDFLANSIALNNLSYLSSTTVTTTSTNTTVLYSFNGLIYGSGKFLIQAISNGNIHNTELLVIHSGITATAVEYARIFNDSSLFTIDVDKTGDTVRILTNSASATSTKYIITFTLNKI